MMMDINLYRKVINSYDVWTPDGLAFKEKEEWIEAETTGRWKIDNRDTESFLYLECLEENIRHEKVRVNEVMGKEYIYDSVWDRILDRYSGIKEKVISYDEKAVKKISFHTFWEHEDNLSLSVIHENTCEPCG